MTKAEQQAEHMWRIQFQAWHGTGDFGGAGEEWCSTFEQAQKKQHEHLPDYPSKITEFVAKAEPAQPDPKDARIAERREVFVPIDFGGGAGGFAPLRDLGYELRYGGAERKNVAAAAVVETFRYLLTVSSLSEMDQRMRLLRAALQECR